MLIDPAAGSRGCAYTIGQRWKSLADCRGLRRGGLGRHVHWADQGLGLIRLPDRHSWISSPTISGSCLHNRHYAKSKAAQRAALRRSPLAGSVKPGSLLPIHSCQYRCYIWGFAPPTGKVTRSLVYRDCPGSPSCIWIFLELPPRSLDHFLGILNEPFCWTMPVQLRIGSQEPLQFLPARGWSTAGDAMIAPQD